MKTVGAYEAKTHFSQLLNDVANGETITITKHGAPVAQLVPPPGIRRADAGAIVDELRAFRRKADVRASVEEIREWIEEGRRY